MSWVEWQGETLPLTKDDADLWVTVEAADSCGPRQNWRFDFGHCLPMPEPRPKRLLYERTLNAEIANMGIELRDWRELSGLTIRSTPEWLARVQECGAYGRVIDPVMEVHHSRYSREDGSCLEYGHWNTIQYELRFGRLDGLVLPCELEAWDLLVPEEYERTEPETAEELRRFAVGPPVLRAMTRVVFQGGSVEMERCGDDPKPLALQRLHEALGDVEVSAAEVHWNVRYPDGTSSTPVKTPGWRSTVSFRTSV